MPLKSHLGTDKMEDNVDGIEQNLQENLYSFKIKEDSTTMIENVVKGKGDGADVKESESENSSFKQNQNAKKKRPIKSTFSAGPKELQKDVLKCQYCEKVYENSIAWRSHQRSHETMNNVNKNQIDIDCNIEYEHKCNRCDRTFKNRGACKLHEKTHQKEKESDGTRSNKEKRKKQKNASEIKCKYCQMVFKNEGAKATHELSHERSSLHRSKMKAKVKADMESNSTVVEKNVKKVDTVKMGSTSVIGLKCGHCGLSFKNAGACRTHEISHYFDLVSGKPKQKGNSSFSLRNKIVSLRFRRRRRKKNYFKEKDLAVDDDNSPKKEGSRVGNDYVCQFCNKHFSSRCRLVVHEKGHNEANNVISVCLLCNQSFLKKTGLVLHMSAKHLNQFTLQENSNLLSSNDYQCAVCNERFNDEVKLDQHVEELHMNVKLEESKIFSNEVNERNLQVDLNREISDRQDNESILQPTAWNTNEMNTNNKRFYCALCKQQYSLKVRLISHNLQSHAVCHSSIENSGNFKSLPSLFLSDIVRNKNKTCSICKKVFNNFSTLFLHKVNHQSKQRLHQKNEIQLVNSKDINLEQNFKRQMKMRKNVLTIKEKFEIHKRYRCNICRKRFLRPYLLKQHLERNHYLDISGIENNFDAKKYLVESFPPRQYLGNNDPQKKYECTICKNRFRRPYLLKNHLEKYHREMPEQSKNNKNCDNIDYITVGISNRLLYKCPDCGLVFIHHNELAQHMKIHNGQMPYQCKLCFKEFKGRHYLIEHKKTDHPQKRDCPCPICGKLFPNKSHVDTHLIMHTGINPHKCPYCDMRFRRKGLLGKHIDKKHTSSDNKKLK